MTPTSRIFALRSVLPIPPPPRAAGLEIGEGTSEIQRVLIARDLGLPVDS